MSASTTSADYPNTNSSINTSSMSAAANDNLQNAKDTVVNSEVSHPILSNSKQDLVANQDLVFPHSAAAYNAVANHPLTQNVKDTVANGPVAENAKEQAIKTQNEFSNLAAARTTPSQPAATGQPLTHYHSFFSSLLSWENPRASAIAYVAIVLFIFGARYLNLLRYAFKFTWMTLGVTVIAEIAGKTLFSQGLASQMRPRKYYTLPRETLDAMIGDVHELVNFFVIESQRIMFAENVFASAAACVAAFLSYYLIKIVPFWGMCLIGTSVMFLVPLIYISNQELIDHHIRQTTSIVNQQTEQVKQLASHHAAVAANTTKQYASDYTAKAQEMVGVKPSRSSSPEVIAKPIKAEPVSSSFSTTNAAVPAYKPADFPAAPKEDFKTTTLPTVGSTASTLREEEVPVNSA